MGNKEKPKCYMCSKSEEEPYYIWYRGHLYHMSCYIEIDWSINENRYKDMDIDLLNRIIVGELTHRDFEEYVRNPNYINALVGRFYKRLKVNPELIMQQLLSKLTTK